MVATAIQNAPWENDDREVLRNNWRGADDTARQLEKNLGTIELIKVKFGLFEKDTPDHDALSLDTSRLICDSVAILVGQFSTQDDFKWFCENVKHNHLGQIREIMEDIERAKIDEFLFILQAERFVCSLATTAREFAAAMEFSLNTWADPTSPNIIRFQREADGIQVNGRLVEVVGKAADVLYFLCQKIDAPSDYEDFADLFDSDDTWKIGLYTGDTEAIDSAKKSIRNCLSTIRKAIRLSFGLSEDQDPVPKVKTADGWQLNKKTLV
jgi:hypothetical protein